MKINQEIEYMRELKLSELVEELEFISDLHAKT